MAGSSNIPIEVAGAAKRYGKVQALAGIDLAIPSGGITAILGPNGAGKTTLINILLGHVAPSQGKALVFGGKPGRMAARKRIGAMLQDTELPENLTVKEHLALFSAYYPDPRPVEESLALGGLEDLAGRKYNNLSGGQKRRVQFAAAVAGRPELVFLDEPTTGLDLEARQTLWQVVQGLAEEGVTIILTTHYLEEADRLADRIVVIDRGTMVADGATAEIRTRVGGKKVRCLTTLAAEQVENLPEVRSALRTGRYLDILTSDEVATLRSLLAQDDTISDVSVAGTGLEDAFRALTGKTETGDLS
ncbi:MAG: ABC transporter ATP-binding protein [Aquisalinus sp.]|nr:ABC transporter ATP-binding protein [Aquisalinus sp.]